MSRRQGEDAPGSQKEPLTAHAARDGTGQSPGRLAGPRGCLRDSQGDIISFTLNSEVIRMDNYCVMFEITL